MLVPKNKKYATNAQQLIAPCCESYSLCHTPVPQMWGWLGTDTATANDIYARFLPKNTYSSARVGSSKQSSVPPSPGGTIDDSFADEPLKAS